MDSSFSSFGPLDSNKQYNSIERSYIHLKVSRARFQPVPDGQLPSFLVTGSYTELNNSVDLWSCPQGKTDESSPRNIDSVQVNGDVTELRFIDRHNFLVSTRRGDLLLFKIEGDRLEEVKKWDKSQIVYDNLSFAGFDVANGIVALASVDGEVFCFPYTESSEAPSNLINSGKDIVKAVSFVRRDEVALGNLRGQISLWDIRGNLLSPAMSFPYNADTAVGVSRLSPFPLQKHVLAAAGCDGTLATWDLRNVSNSHTIYAAHNKMVTDLRFHDMRPGNAFTCSFAGDVWHWTNFDELLGASASTQHLGSLGGCKPAVRGLLPEKKFPVNCVDVCGDVLVAACDNDSLVFVKNLKLK